MGNTLVKGQGRGRYTRKTEIRECTAPLCRELFPCAMGRKAAYCSPSCKQAAFRYRQWDTKMKRKATAD